MNYNIGDGEKFKIRLSKTRDTGFVVADTLVKLAAEAIMEKADVGASVIILDCARKIQDALKELREEMP